MSESEYEKAIKRWKKLAGKSSGRWADWPSIPRKGTPGPLPPRGGRGAPPAHPRRIQPGQPTNPNPANITGPPSAHNPHSSVLDVIKELESRIVALEEEIRLLKCGPCAQCGERSEPDDFLCGQCRAAA